MEGPAPEMTRTSDLRFRKPPLYPAELLGRIQGDILPAGGASVNADRCQRRPGTCTASAGVPRRTRAARLPRARRPPAPPPPGPLTRASSLATWDTVRVPPSFRASARIRSGRRGSTAAGACPAPRARAQVPAGDQPQADADQGASDEERLDDDREDRAHADEQGRAPQGDEGIPRDAARASHACSDLSRMTLSLGEFTSVDVPGIVGLHDPAEHRHSCAQRGGLPRGLPAGGPAGSASLRPGGRGRGREQREHRPDRSGCGALRGRPARRRAAQGPVHGPAQRLPRDPG